MGYAEAQYTVDELLSYMEVNEASGIPPKVMTCSVSAAPRKGINCLFFPENTVVNGQAIVTVKGVIIVAKKDSIPQNINDGELITNRIDDAFDHLANPLVLTLPTYGEWYVRFFPYSTENVFSYADEHIFHVTLSGFINIATFKQDFTNLDPNSSITYLNENAGYRPMMTNASNGTVTYGDWMDRWEWLQKIRPYMLNNDGTVDYALDPNDYTRKADGTPSDVSNPNYTGAGAFVWIPKLYTKNVYNSDNTVRTVYFSEKKIDSGYTSNGFVDRDGNELEGVWIPMFYTSSQFKSIAGSRELDFVIDHDTGYTYLGGHDGTEIIGGRTLTALKTYLDNIFGEHRYAFLGGEILDVLRDVLYLLYKSPNLIDCNGSVITNKMGESVGDNGLGFIGEITDGPGIFYGKNRTLPVQHNKLFHSIVLCGINKSQDIRLDITGITGLDFPSGSANVYYVRFTDISFFLFNHYQYLSDSGVYRANRYLDVNEPPENYSSGGRAAIYIFLRDNQNLYDKISDFNFSVMNDSVPSNIVFSKTPGSIIPCITKLRSTVIPDSTSSTGLCVTNSKMDAISSAGSGSNISNGLFSVTRCHGGYPGTIYNTMVHYSNSPSSGNLMNSKYSAHSLMLIPRPGYTPY